jgi:AraC-like DNA-binding protein
MRSRRASFQDVHFHNPRLSNVGVEVLTFAELRRRAGPLLSAPQRVDFHHLIFAQEGTTTHMVDFVEHKLTPGSVLLVRPGQVQQWRMRDGGDGRDRIEGQLVLVASVALPPTDARSDADMRLLALADWPAIFRPSQELFVEAVSDVSRLRADVARFAGTHLEAAIIRHELLTLLLRLARELRSATGAREATREAEIHALFAKELEASFAMRLRVLDYAKRLHVSESTLSRASVAMVGCTTKDEINRRITLEAKRLLVHSQAPAAKIGHQLGFTEPTNFVKFFKRAVGCTPSEFRQAHTIATPADVRQ